MNLVTNVEFEHTCNDYVEGYQDCYVNSPCFTITQETWLCVETELFWAHKCLYCCNLSVSDLPILIQIKFLNIRQYFKNWYGVILEYQFVKQHFFNRDIDFGLSNFFRSVFFTMLNLFLIFVKIF